jgi:hypothetical protein
MPAWLARLSPRRLLRHLRWVSLRRVLYAALRRVRLWRLARLPRIPLDDDLFELASGVAERTDDILSSVARSQDTVVQDWFRHIEPKIRELSATAFRLVGTAQELRTALVRIQSGPDPGRVAEILQHDLLDEQDPEMQRFVAQTMYSEQKKSDSLEQCRKNLRLIGAKLGAITSFLDSIYLRVPNVKVLADRQDWFAELSGELDNELRGLEATFEEFRQVTSSGAASVPPALLLQDPPPGRPAASGWTVDLRRRRE